MRHVVIDDLSIKYFLSQEGIMKHKILILMAAVIVFIGMGTASILAECGSKTYTGYLADLLCVNSGFAADGANMATNPEKHTVYCALMEPCIASGYTLLVKNSAGGFDSYHLDDRGNRLAVNYLRKTQKKDNILVRIKGSMENNTINVESIQEVN